MIEKLINNLLEVLSLKKSINNEIPNIIEKIREAIASDTNLFIRFPPIIVIDIKIR